MSFAFEENPHGIQQGRRSVSMEGERARCPAKRPRRQAGHGVKPGREWAKREGRKMPPGGRHANCEPSEAGRSWKGGAREQADDVFFCRRHKKMSEQSGLCSDVAPPARLERTTFRLGGGPSIPVRYGGRWWTTGLFYPKPVRLSTAQRSPEGFFSLRRELPPLQGVPGPV